MDLYSASRNLPRSLIRNGAPWCLCFDFQHSPAEDLLSSALRSRIEFLLRHGTFAASGPVCSSFSTAITPPCRTWEILDGVPWCSPLQQQKCKDGNSHCRWYARLVRLCSAHKVVFSIKNPCGSWFRKQKCWGTLRTDSWQDFGVDYCRFGTRWRKRTRFRTNSCLGSEKVFCRCARPHVQLRSHCRRRGVLYTKLAEPYPRKLCELLSLAILSSADLIPDRRKLNVASCSLSWGSDR